MGENERSAEDAMDVFGQGKLNSRIDPDLLRGALEINEDELEWRKDFINFDEDDAERLADLEALFRDHQDDIAEQFYENIRAYEETTEVVGRSPKGIEELQETQRAYLLSLARGRYDREYFVDRARIGMLHYMLGMPMKQYIGQYGVYYELLFSLIRERVENEVVAAAEGWAKENDGGGFLGGLSGSSDTELSAEFEAELREAIDDGMDDLLSVFRIMNLDMQMATDAYNYANKRRDVIDENEDDDQDGLADEVSDILASGED